MTQAEKSLTLNMPLISEKIISVVVPAYNEEEVLREFHHRLINVFNGIKSNLEIIYINDGSTDNTRKVLDDIANSDTRVAIVDLSRNFGKELALTAGLDYANGDAIVIIDADLQDPPELIPELLAKSREGYDVVYAKRTSREGETVLKKINAYLFYRVMYVLGCVKIPIDTGDYRVISRRALDSLKQLREQHRFMKGLFAWVGFPQTEVPYRRDARFAGKTKYNYWKLWNFALEGITSFTTAPLKLATYIGVLTAGGSFLFGLKIIVNTLVQGNPVPGYPSLITVVLFLGGIQLLTLGVIGEYLARVFNETKQRPLYIVKDYKASHVKI